MSITWGYGASVGTDLPLSPIAEKKGERLVLAEHRGQAMHLAGHLV